MPAPQLLTAALEVAINQALTLSNVESFANAGLSGKRLILNIHEAQLTLVFCFAERDIDVGVQPDWQQADKENIDDDSVYVSLSVSALSELRDKSKLTSLIKQGKLDFYGDLKLLQTLSKWFESIDVDVEDVLANYIGDVPAYWLNRQVRNTSEKIKTLHNRSMSALANYALEENSVAVTKIEMMNFSDNVNDLRADVARIEARLDRLEHKLS